MINTDPDLYLPISDQVLHQILDEEAGSLDTAISSLPVPQLAALVLLRDLPKLKENQSLSPERFLSEVIKAVNAQVKRDGLPAVTASILPNISRLQIHEGHYLLSEYRIALLDEESLKHRSYLTAEGEWDYNFKTRRNAQRKESLVRVSKPAGVIQFLTPEQTRIYMEVKAQADEHMHVQGYAGTGKSSLIKSLLAMFESTNIRILVLAERRQQLKALLAEVGKLRNVFGKAFGDLAREIISQNKVGPSRRHLCQAPNSWTPVPDKDLIQLLGIRESGEFLPRDIVKAVRGSVVRFCRSGDNEVNAIHVPDEYASSFDETTRQIVLHHAATLWQAILSPPAHDVGPLVRGYHQIKWVALKRMQIPARYTHVLIDECHDLATPMLQILDCSPQAVISLGDEYQNLQGRPQRRSNIIRQREAQCSVRSGCQLERIVNPIIKVHPGETKAPFQGNPFNKIEIKYYDKPMVPNQPATILASDHWELLEWIQRLAAEDLDVLLLRNRNDLATFVEGCIGLYVNQDRPRHGKLFRFGSWDKVADVYHANRGFQRVDRMLRGGYDHKNWHRTLDRIVDQSTRSYSLGLIEDARNREFDTVMVTPQVVDRAWHAKSTTFAERGSEIYVAVTRATRRLIVPEKLRNWIEEISAT